MEARQQIGTPMGPEMAHVPRPLTVREKLARQVKSIQILKESNKSLPVIATAIFIHVSRDFPASVEHQGADIAYLSREFGFNPVELRVALFSDDAMLTNIVNVANSNHGKLDNGPRNSAGEVRPVTKYDVMRILREDFDEHADRKLREYKTQEGLVEYLETYEDVLSGRRARTA